jgi:nicotinate-nucleotide--dimethylbenzimidazole phosphoribosyltransferase
MDSVLEQVIAGIGPLNLEKTGECYAKLSSLAVPQDGKLTYLAGRIAGVSDTLQPSLLKKAVVLFAADHAVDGGENKTKGMGSKAAALEIAAGKGHINKVAHQIGAGVLLLDMGLEQNIPESEGVQDLKVMHGSHFWAKGPAMTEDQMLDAMFSGLQIGENLADEHYNALGLGNIGERGLLTAFILTAAFFRDSMNDLPSHMKSQGKLEQLTALMDRLGLDAGDPLDLLRRAGSPDIAAMVGARLVLPGPHLDGDSLLQLLAAEKVTVGFGVPVIWAGLLAAMRRTEVRLPEFKRALVGGSALPPSMAEAFQRDYGIALTHAWGMTETSPIDTINTPLSKHDALPAQEQQKQRAGQGRPIFGIELQVVDVDGEPLPRDGQSQGYLQVRGHWVVEQYYGQDASALTAAGWFDTGDIGTLDANGY